MKLLALFVAAMATSSAHAAPAGNTTTATTKDSAILASQKPLVHLHRRDDQFSSVFASQLALQARYEQCWPGMKFDTWGPHDPCFSQNIPDIPTARARLVLAADYYTKQGLIYAHQHDPYWINPKTGKKGIDCSNLTAWLYNFVLGIYFSSDITAQSSMSLPRVTDYSSLGNGDIVFFSGGEKLTKITHAGIVVRNGSTITVINSSSKFNGPFPSTDTKTWPLNSFQYGFHASDIIGAWNNNRKSVVQGLCALVPVNGKCSSVRVVRV